MLDKTKQEIKYLSISLVCFIFSGFALGGWVYISLIKVGSFINWGLLYALAGVIIMVVGIEYFHKLDDWVTDKTREEDARRKN